MRIFLDVGAHVGETLIEVAKDRYRFDRIVAFEPSAACLPALQVMADKDTRIEICRAGLSNRTATAQLFHAGSLAGSVIGEIGGDNDHGNSVETVSLIEASSWLRDNTAPTDFIVMKTNCEGSEVDIVDNLLKMGMLERLYVLLITFDIRVYPGGLATEKAMRRRLAKVQKPNFCLSDDVMIGLTHEDRIHHWLHLYGVDSLLGDPAELRRNHTGQFERYARKSGRFVLFEHWVKAKVSYANFPQPVKRLLQLSKRALGLHRERATDDDA
jgi:FkbM family methyltransferase